jgi:2-dehydropantoate 2-reductase
MKIAVIGTGGVGGYFGARLAKSGEDVTFIARGEHLAAMRKDGLKILSANGDVTINPVKASDAPASVGVVDWVFVAVKLWSTEDAARDIAPMVGPQTNVVSFQNGVVAEDVLIARYGRERVVGGVANIAALIEAPGVIRHNGSMARLIFGELDGRKSQRCETLLAACQRAAFDAVIPDDINVAIWDKFVFLASFSGLTSVTRLPIGPIREDSETRALLRDALAEVVAVARAKGVALPKDILEKKLKWADDLPAAMVASMAGDLQRGNRLELPWLSGTVVKLGEELGVPTPVHKFLYLALKLHAQGSKVNVK